MAIIMAKSSQKLKLPVVCSFIVILLGAAAAFNLDKPCVAKRFNSSSVVCVCNSTYCDTITRDAPLDKQVVTYTSSESGLRFKKVFSSLEKCHENKSHNSTTLELDPTTRYQTINGFGGAVTDAAGINWSNLTNPQLKKHLIESYCGHNGLQYNMIRVPMGACDFSLRNYTYCDHPEGDVELKNFSLAFEDHQYKIPMIKACMEAANVPIHVIGSTWSPPIWMKTNNDFTGIGYLKKEYYQTYADYYRKFVEAYNNEGVAIWGITTTNEPINGAVNLAQINDLGWTVTDMADWIADNLGPTMRKYHPSVKLIGVDDQRFTLALWFALVVENRIEVAKFLDGVALHFYFDTVTPPETITDIMSDYPDLFVLATEASQGDTTGVTVDLGSWDRADTYIKSIIEDLTYNMIGWMDWNICLNEDGGPHWTEAGLDAAIIVNAEKGLFYKQPMYYALGHFSKFIPRGSRRIKSAVKLNGSTSVKHVAFSTPDDTIVLVLYNEKDEERLVYVELCDSEAKVPMMPKSITTMEFKNICGSNKL